MIHVQTVTVLICDRCKRQVDEVSDFYGHSESASVCSHAEQFDLCGRCLKAFRKFMEAN